MDGLFLDHVSTMLLWMSLSYSSLIILMIAVCISYPPCLLLLLAQSYDLRKESWMIFSLSLPSMALNAWPSLLVLAPGCQQSVLNLRLMTAENRQWLMLRFVIIYIVLPHCTGLKELEHVVISPQYWMHFSDHLLAYLHSTLSLQDCLLWVASAASPMTCNWA